MAFVLFDDQISVKDGFAHMDGYGQVEIVGDLDLPDEDAFLGLDLRFVPVVIETDLADCDHFLILGRRDQPIEIGIRNLMGAFGMETDSSIDVWVLAGDRQRPFREKPIIADTDELATASSWRLRSLH
jgi:hypothetical protein